jgi:hypothetical protein
MWGCFWRKKMSQVFVLPGFNVSPDKLYCSTACAQADDQDPNDPDSILFPIDKDRFEIQKDVMNWGDSCKVCGKGIFSE